ncbi:Cyclin pch1 AltName: Full=Pombe cyclin C homolog 1 [Serendipita indica DSM 11827]|uniref:Cyclin-like domain-containing protein n=1 Tax=Serendipita indica (strain DSM 11827) TaxID=1109443 RepID=G4T7I0_SERID|nr:Cyclin pch1 AltName: Full=Pombe cyclin C homolog 1 [Serendipita indica DSM 11827]CCA67260.1 hypothetical protein PIIN_01093 [Serendipita indica DSM 11827]
MASQWQFSLEQLRKTPSMVPLETEIARRVKGVDWLMRVGATLMMGLGPCLTAATYLHRFYMRRMLEDYHELEIAATCLFLASKTEESGVRLDDLVTVTLSKVHACHPSEVAGKYDNEAKRWEQAILANEEVLLEVLCFDFDVRHAHAQLADLVGGPSKLDPKLISCLWSVAHDSYRTPLCILESPQVIAAACFLFAQCLVDGPRGSTLADRISDPQSEWRRALGVSENDLQSIAVSLTILCQYYRAHKPDFGKPDTSLYKLIEPPPTGNIDVPLLFQPLSTSQHSNGGFAAPSLDYAGSKTPQDSPLPPSTTPLGPVPPFPADASHTSKGPA